MGLACVPCVVGLQPPGACRPMRTCRVMYQMTALKRSAPCGHHSRMQTPLAARRPMHKKLGAVVLGALAHGRGKRSSDYNRLISSDNGSWWPHSTQRPQCVGRLLPPRGAVPTCQAEGKSLLRPYSVISLRGMQRGLGGYSWGMWWARIW